MAKEQPEMLTGSSLNISAENRIRLKQLFPSVFTEIENDRGEIVESIDFEKLKAELGTFSDLFESRRERYGMDWPGKKEAQRLIQTLSFATLKPCREESVNFDTTENLFIEGDNLEVLKLLQKSYYGKVKMIYIDPPYNTGKEFIYPDNFSENLETYLEYAGLIDGEGKKFSTNSASEGRFHTKWLNMMYPRLYLARNLLRDDGVIFISIDDNEVNNLRKICDEIFGEDNFFAILIRRAMHTVRNSSKDFNLHADYLLTYAKNKQWFASDKSRYIRQIVDKTDSYPYDDNDGRGVYKLDPLSARNYYTPYTHTFKNGIVWSAPEGSFPRYAEETLEEMEAENQIVFDRGEPKAKRHLKDVQDGQPPNTILSPEDVGFNSTGTKELRETIGKDKLFTQPKPIELIKHLNSLLRDDDSIVLDFFSGSATTAHAVLDLNKDGGKRKFILVQLPEPCAEDSEAFKAGYKTIAEIGKERIRRVIKKLNEEQKDKSDLEQTGKQDRGFKVLKLDKSNFKQWQKLEPSTPPEIIAKQLDTHIDHISHKATPEDLLYEILLKAGFTLTEKIEIKTIAGQKVFSVAEGAFLLCLEDNITKNLIDAIADAEPMQFVCLDSAFHGNDQLKANAMQTFAARNMQKEKHNQIIFKTV